MPKPSPIADLDFMPKWEPAGACYDQPNLMEPDRHDEHAIRQALDICYSCPVLDRCRDWVLSLTPVGDPGGVVGGLTPSQRGLTNESTKLCTRCNKVLPTTDFAPHTKGSARLRSYCRPCGREAERATRAANKTRTEAAA